MPEPFRDAMDAAVQRAETLEDENQTLREEIERLRTVANSPSPDAAGLAAQATRVLENLDAISQRHPRILPLEIPAHDREERAEIDMPAEPFPPKKNAPSPSTAARASPELPSPARPSPAFVFALCAASFLLGLLAEWVIAH